MPGPFLTAIVVAIIAALCFGAAVIARRAASGTLVTIGARVAGAVFGAVALILVLLAAWNPVPTQDIGIVTSFGQPIGHLSAGGHFTAPWDQVTDMDEAVQLTDDTFTVRIAGGQTALATVQARWQVAPGAADDVFRNYRNSTSGVENGLLTPELNAATNSVLDGYDPLTPLATGALAGTPSNPSTTQLATEIQQALIPRLGGDIHLITLVLKPLAYDATVQARINSVLTQTAKTDVAKQSELTAQAQAKANEIIQQSLANNPLALVQQCMNAIADGSFSPPAGFSCWPGSGSGIVIPASK